MTASHANPFGAAEAADGKTVRKKREGGDARDIWLHDSRFVARGLPRPSLPGYGAYMLCISPPCC